MEDFRKSLPKLLSLYRHGVLTPFTGSGMSCGTSASPACRSWLPFLLELAGAAKVRIDPIILERKDKNLPQDTGQLYRLADAAVRRLQCHGWETFEKACRTALWADSENEAKVPEQTKALGSLYWPLVLTTNYDDLFLRASERVRYRILGQSLGDCREVLRSLDAVGPPVFWALQGHLGNGALAHERLNPERLARLSREVVVGYQQYQSVINAKAHLRRALAEVFRRRSLLFLGSGLQEDYLLNLLGEIIHHHGHSSYPHFALFRREDVIDAWFLERRLGINVLRFEDYKDLPGLLEDFVTHAKPRRDTGEKPVMLPAWLPHEIGFRLQVGASAAEDGFQLRLRYGRVRAPLVGACSAASVGRGKAGLLIGSIMKDLLDDARLPADGHPDAWSALDENGYVYSNVRNPQIFAVAARPPQTLDGEVVSERNLQEISKAMNQFLIQVDRVKEYRSASLGLLAAGPMRPWPGIYALVMMLTAIRDCLRSSPLSFLRELEIAIVDPSVWSPLVEGRIHVDALLSSEFHKVWIQQTGGEDMEPEVYSLRVEGPMSLRQLLKRSGVGRGRWRVVIFPVPDGRGQNRQDWGDIAILPLSTVMITPASDNDSDAGLVVLDDDADE